MSAKYLTDFPYWNSIHVFKQPIIKKSRMVLPIVPNCPCTMHSKGSSINDVTLFFGKLFTPSPHCHTFYYKGLGTIVTKASTPSPPLRPWRHLWMTPNIISFCLAELPYSINVCVYYSVEQLFNTNVITLKIQSTVVKSDVATCSYRAEKVI